MKVWVDNAWRELTPLAAFRAAHALPESFTVAWFSPKDWHGLSRVDTPAVAQALATIKQRVLAAMPTHLRLADLLDWPPRLGVLFERELVTANATLACASQRLGLRFLDFRM